MRWRLWIGLVLLAGMWTAPGQPAAFSITRSTTSDPVASSLTGAFAPIADTVQSTVTTLALSSSSVASGSPVTLTATVTAGGSPVSPGMVTFCNAAATYCEAPAVLGTAQLTPNGTASIKLFLGIGTHSIKAVFAGTNSDATSSSTAQTLTVTGVHPTTTTIASSGSAGDYTLTATVTGSGDSSGANRQRIVLRHVEWQRRVGHGRVRSVDAGPGFCPAGALRNWTGTQFSCGRRL